jgi:hypothetical protein
MLRITLDKPESGWACARLNDGDKELVVTAPYSPADVIRDLIDAVQSLRTAESADCCWSQEPGELHWRLRRVDSEIDVEILRFAKTAIPGSHRGESERVFSARDKWLTFARQLLSSLDSSRTELGTDGYESCWRHPFPSEAQEKLREAIQKSAQS